MATAQPQKLQAYKRHIVGYSLQQNHPYLDDISSHLGAHEVSTAYGVRLFPRLVELLRSESIEPKELVEALRTVRDLSSSQENAYQSILAVPAISDLMLHADVGVQRAAVRALSRVAMLLAGRQALAESHAAERLSKLLLSAEDGQVKANVAECMANFSVARDGCEHLVAEKCIHAIAEHLHSALPLQSAVSAECALGLLVTLRHVSVWAGGARDLIGHGVLGKIVEFTATPEASALLGSKASEAVVSALAVVGAMWMDPRGPKELLHANAVETLARLLSHPDGDVREKAAAGLLALAADLDGKRRLVNHVGEIAGFLTAAAETEYAQSTCRRVACSAGELPAFRRDLTAALVDAGAAAMLVDIYGCDVCVPLSELLEQRKGKKRERMMEALALALAGPGSAEREPVAFALGACPGLVERVLGLSTQQPGAVASSVEVAKGVLAKLATNPLGKAELERLQAK